MLAGQDKVHGSEGLRVGMGVGYGEQGGRLPHAVSAAMTSRPLLPQKQTLEKQR